MDCTIVSTTDISREISVPAGSFFQAEQPAFLRKVLRMSLENRIKPTCELRTKDF